MILTPAQTIIASDKQIVDALKTNDYFTVRSIALDVCEAVNALNYNPNIKYKGNNK